MMKIGLERMLPNPQGPTILGHHTGLFLRIFLLKYYCLFVIKVNDEFHSVLVTVDMLQGNGICPINGLTVCILTAKGISG